MSRILIVEDNPANRRLSTVLLRSAGFETEAAADAEEAEAAIQAHLPDLILMDLGLPGRDGYALARDLRARAETRAIPILAVSAFAMRSDERRALEAGCAAFLSKPIDRLTLLGQVRSLLASGGGIA
jgi:CheY-like chemotaxis protein